MIETALSFRSDRLVAQALVGLPTCWQEKSLIHWRLIFIRPVYDQVLRRIHKNWRR